MKILIDQNISHRIVGKIETHFDVVTHVKSLQWIDFPDIAIFRNARNLGFDAIISLDEDFSKIIIEYSPPPKIIWLRIGNCSTETISTCIINKIDLIYDFIADNEHECLEIFSV